MSIRMSDIMCGLDRDSIVPTPLASGLQCLRSLTDKLCCTTAHKRQEAGGTSIRMQGSRLLHLTLRLATCSVGHHPEFTVPHHD